METATVGRLLILGGALVVVAGVLLVWLGRIPMLGRLPGDLVIRGDGYTVYLPITTMVILSLILSLVAALLLRWWR